MQLMEYSRQEIDKLLEEGSKNMLSKSKFNKMKKNSSFLSMENLDM